MNTKIDRCERLAYIDVAKGILIALVVIGHVLIGSVFVTKVMIRAINSFHMPAFFIISGFLTKEEKIRKCTFLDFFINKASRLMLPYIVFELLGAFVQTVMIMPKSIDIPGIMERIITVHCYVLADWFLVALFFAELILYWVVKYMHPKWHILLVCVSFLLAFIMPEPNWFLANCRRIVVSLGFILLGVRGKKLLEYDCWLSFLLTSVAFLIGIAFNTGTPSIALRLFENPFLFILCGWCGTYILLFLSRRLATIHLLEKLLSQCGKASLVIMGTHQNVLLGYVILYGNWTTFATKFLLLGVIAFMEIPVIFLCKRYVPSWVGHKRDNSERQMMKRYKHRM